MDHGYQSFRRSFRALIGPHRWSALLENGVLRSYRPGAFLLRQGERGGHLLALTSGRVKVLAQQEDGSQLLLSLRGAGDLVGEMAVSPENTRSATVQALERCTARYIPGNAFRRFLDRYDAHLAFSTYLIEKLSETVPQQMHLAHATARQRIARLLLDVVALADPDHPDPLRVPFSQEGLAVALGMSRSTVAEHVAALRAKGALAPGPRLVVADLTSLVAETGPPAPSHPQNCDGDHNRTVRCRTVRPGCSPDPCSHGTAKSHGTREERR